MQELEEDVTSIDGLDQFAESEMGARVLAKKQVRLQSMADRWQISGRANTVIARHVQQAQRSRRKKSRTSEIIVIIALKKDPRM